MKKWILACVLVALGIALLCLNISAVSMSAGGVCGPNAYWKFEEETGTLTIYGQGVVRQRPWYSSVEQTHHLVKHVVVEEGITELESYSFADCINLETVQLPQSLEVIGGSVFQGCSGLTQIELKENVQILGRDAFASCHNLERISLGGSLQKIGTCCFFACLKLQSISLPDTLTHIGQQAFLSCSSLEQVYIGAGVCDIDEDAFAGCDALMRFTVSSNNQVFKDLDGVLFTDDETVLVEYPNARAGEYAIPNSVVRIGEKAFYDCDGLIAVTIPGTVREIGANAFGSCSALAQIHMEEGVETIGFSAFSCEILRQITIPASVTRVEDQALDCSSLEQVIFLGDKPFLGEDLWHVDFMAFYPAGNPTWEGTYEQLNGKILWKEACAGEHVVIVDPAVSANCLQTGMTKGAHCANCGMIMQFRDRIDMTDHTYGPWQTIREPSLDSTGWEERSCGVCGKIESRVLPLMEPVEEQNEKSGWGVVILVAGGALAGGLIGWRTWQEEKRRKRL